MGFRVLSEQATIDIPSHETVGRVSLENFNRRDLWRLALNTEILFRQQTTSPTSFPSQSPKVEHELHWNRGIQLVQFYFSSNFDI